MNYNFLSNINPFRKREEAVTVEKLLKSAAVQKRVQHITAELMRQTDSLTKKDIESWRKAWQAAIDFENPSRAALYDVYTDSLVDLHMTGCISQRKGKTLQKAFKLTKDNGKEDEAATAIFMNDWFFDFMDYSLDVPYWGHSLIQFGDIIRSGKDIKFENVELIPRKHVVQEYGVITREPGEDWHNGYSYREGELADWCLEVGKPRDLGLLLKCAPHGGPDPALNLNPLKPSAIQEKG